MFLLVYSLKVDTNTQTPILLACKKNGALYGLELGQIKPLSRQVSSCLHTSAYLVGKRQYCLGFHGQVVSPRRSIMCSAIKRWNNGSSKIFEYLQSNSMIARLLNSRATGGSTPQTPYLGLSSAPVANPCPEGYKKVNQPG